MQLRAIREARGLTQKQLSEIANVSQPNISDVENGHVVPTVATASRIAKALGCTIDELISEKETPDANLPNP